MKSLFIFKKSVLMRGLSMRPYEKHWKAGEDKLEIGYKGKT